MISGHYYMTRDRIRPPYKSQSLFRILTRTRSVQVYMVVVYNWVRGIQFLVHKSIQPDFNPITGLHCMVRDSPASRLPVYEPLTYVAHHMGMVISRNRSYSTTSPVISFGRRSEIVSMPSKGPLDKLRRLKSCCSESTTWYYTYKAALCCPKYGLLKLKVKLRTH